MEVAFSGINIYSKKPEAVFEFYKKLGFRVLEEVAPDDKWYGSTLALQDGDNAPIIWIWRQSDEDNSVVCNHFVFSTNGKMDEVRSAFGLLNLKQESRVSRHLRRFGAAESLSCTTPKAMSCCFYK